MKFIYHKKPEPLIFYQYDGSEKMALDIIRLRSQIIDGTVVSNNPVKYDPESGWLRLDRYTELAKGDLFGISQELGLLNVEDNVLIPLNSRRAFEEYEKFCEFNESFDPLKIQNNKPI